MTGEPQPTPTLADTGPRMHDIGPAGVVVISVEADDVRVRGVEGTEARVVSPAAGVGLETSAERGRFIVRVVRAEGFQKGAFLGIQLGSRGFGFPLRGRFPGTLEVEVPHDARVEVHAHAGDIAVRDVRGGVAVKTASGDVSVKRAAGLIAIEAASGDVDVIAVDPVELTVRSVAGDVEARAPRFERVAIETVSGDVELVGAFAPGPLHAISTVSGDIEVAFVGGLTLEAKTVSGRLEVDHPARRDGDARKRPLVIGDGAARLVVGSMSGDVEVRAARAAPGAANRGAAAMPPARPATPPPPGFPLPPEPGRPADPGRPGAPASAAPAESPSEEKTQAATAERAAPEDPAVLAALEALARGEIDVAEAERRLAGASTRAGADRPAGDDDDG